MSPKQASTMALLTALLLSGIPTSGLGQALFQATNEATRPAEEDPPPADEDPRVYRALATRATPGTPAIDARLDDPEWELAQAFSDFVQRDPEEGEPATERTVFRVLYDDQAIYVGIRAYDSEPDKIVGRLTRRDQFSESDWLVVSIDSYYDRRTAFEFRVNPAGVERDQYRYDDTNSDVSWDAVWNVATRVDQEGWVAEFRIPYSQLRFSPAPDHVWGFNVERVIQRKNETAQWKPIPKDGSGWVSEYGELTGIEGINPPRRLEVLPYIAGAQFQTQVDRDDPFRDGSDFNGSVGADVKLGVTNNLTLDVSLNPDFGEVEADPSVVNLGVFETFFQEKRPFFIEGSNIYQFSIQSHNGSSQKLFHSRRIGRAPRGSPDNRGGFVDAPDKTTILAAAKLTGKTADGWSVGVLESITAEETAAISDSIGLRHREVVEPLTNYAVGRVQRDFREGRSALGVMATAVNREITAPLDFLRSAAYAGGLDARHRFAGDNWELRGKLIGSYITGSTEAIEDAQRSSARFFQRPDADHLSFDPDRTSLTGSAGALALEKIGGEHWRGNANIEWVSPGFEVNDLGFQREADVIRHNLWVGYREQQPGKIFRRYYLNYNLWNRLTFGNERTATGTNINGSFTLLNYWGGWGGIGRWFPALSPRFLRGGPAFKSPGGLEYWYGINTDNRKSVWLEAGGWGFSDDERSGGGGVWAFIVAQPVDNARLTLGPEYSWNHDDWQFVTTQESEFGTHYVTGVLSQNTIYLTTRLDWTFRPNLSLQLYAQPFISSGDYREFREVVAPRADAYDDRFETYGDDRLSFEPADDLDEWGTYNVDQDADGTDDFSFGDPNFNFKQFNLNLVLRWEYMAGSTMFLVWSQNKTRTDPTGQFRPASDFGDLFGVDGENTFRFKVNYYLNP